MRDNFIFEAYGLKVKICSNSKELLTAFEGLVSKAFIGNHKIIELNGQHVSEPDFVLTFNNNGQNVSFTDENGKTVEVETSIIEELFLRKIRVLIAEFAVDHVFVHAGVVAYKDRLIVIPGTSGSGKTTLTAELVKHGAVYYSDEYAVIDKDGMVHPFTRDLSIRQEGKWSEKDGVPVEELGGKAGSKPLAVSFVLFSAYEAGANWKPDRISTGQGILELTKHTLPIGHKQEFSFNLLKIAFESAIMIKSMRGESAQAALNILFFIENCID